MVGTRHFSESQQRHDDSPSHADAHGDRIAVVAMDIWRPYRDAVCAVLPQASIVVDKFHVVKMAMPPSTRRENS